MQLKSRTCKSRLPFCRTRKGISIFQYARNVSERLPALMVRKDFPIRCLIFSSIFAQEILSKSVTFTLLTISCPVGQCLMSFSNRDSAPSVDPLAIASLFASENKKI